MGATRLRTAPRRPIAARVRAFLIDTAIVFCALIAGCHSPSSVRRAEVLVAGGDFLAARRVLLDDHRNEAALLALAELEGRLFPHHLERGLAALLEDDPVAAVESFSNALAILPDHEEAVHLHSLAHDRATERRAAIETLHRAAAAGDWRRALLAASEIPPRHLEHWPESLGVERACEVFPSVRRRLFARLALEIERSDRAGALEELRSWIGEAEHALTLRCAGESVPERALAERLDAWRDLGHRRVVAEQYRREAEAGLAGGEQLDSWRQYRLARLRNPLDEEVAAAEADLRRNFRERALLAVDRALSVCDLRAAELALAWIDELDEGWPTELEVSRAEVSGWIADEHARRARALEAQGRLGHALLAWIEADRSGEGEEFAGALSRAVERITRTPRIHRNDRRARAERAPAGQLEVILAPLHVAEAVERTTVFETVGWMRTGVCRTPHPGRSSDARRFERVLEETLRLRDEWLGMAPTRSGLGARRLGFHVQELTRLADRLDRSAATEERGVWQLRELELVHEERRIVVERTLYLLRDGVPIGETTVSVEDRVEGRLPRAAEEVAAQPERSSADDGGQAQPATDDAPILDEEARAVSGVDRDESAAALPPPTARVETRSEEVPRGEIPDGEGSSTETPAAEVASGESESASPESAGAESGELPSSEIPSMGMPLATGIAAAERLRLRLEAECRVRTAAHLEDLRRREVDRLERLALDHARSGDRAEALEMLVAAWVQAEPSDRWTRVRRASLVASWAGLPGLPPELGADFPD